jgi:hypothetical protein
MALRKTPRSRFGSALELLDALEAVMPECFQAGGEQALASYVDELCASHKAELHARMHATQVKHERTRSMRPPAPPNAGESLRAVILDSAADAPRDRMSSMPTVRLAKYARAPSRRVFAVALPAALGVSLALWRGLASTDQHGPTPALARDLVTMPEMGVRSLPVSAPPAPVPEASATQPSEAAQPAPLPITPIESLPQSPRASQFQKLPPRSGGPPAVSAPPRASSNPALVPVSEPSSRANAWDPSTFGGRY